jgi:hypothetical protein
MASELARHLLRGDRGDSPQPTLTNPCELWFFGTDFGTGFPECTLSDTAPNESGHNPPPELK